MILYLVADAELPFDRFLAELSGDEGLSEELTDMCGTLTADDDQATDVARVWDYDSIPMIFEFKAEHPTMTDDEIEDELTTAIFEGGPLETDKKIVLSRP